LQSFAVFKKRNLLIIIADKNEDSKYAQTQPIFLHGVAKYIHLVSFLLGF